MPRAAKPRASKAAPKKPYDASKKASEAVSKDKNANVSKSEPVKVYCQFSAEISNY
jgi:hypothetical protein